MTTVLIIAAATCVCLIVSVVCKPNIKIGKKSIGLYWIVALAGALAMLCSGKISPSRVFSEMTAASSVNPIKILVLFLSMSAMSVFLDEIGFFRYLAGLVLRRAKTSRFTLFVYLYLVVSVLTIFTSNDIVILTFTPFICYFAKGAGINPVPYLFAEFTAANTWSMMLIIGNPTNVYLATSNGINFLEYVKVMALPAVSGGVCAFALLLCVFAKELRTKMEPVEDNYKVRNKGLLIIGLLHLGICTVLLAVSSYIGIEMWLITLCFAVSLFVWSTAYQLISKRRGGMSGNVLRRLPWQLVPFVLSMFVIVAALKEWQVTDIIAAWFGEKAAVWVYGGASYLASNLINNIPMSVLFSSITASAPAQAALSATYAAIIGSNVGAVLTPIGALAGIMWISILRRHDVEFGFAAYVKYGIIISVPTLAAALLALTASL